MIGLYLHYNKQQPNLWRLFLGWKGRELGQTSSSNHLKSPDEKHEYSKVHHFSKKGQVRLQHWSLYERFRCCFFSFELSIKNLPFCKDTKSTGAEVRNKRSWQNQERNFRGTLNLAITPYFLSNAVQLWACYHKHYNGYFSPLSALWSQKKASAIKLCQKLPAPFLPLRRKQRKSASCPGVLLQLQRSCLNESLTRWHHWKQWQPRSVTAMGSTQLESRKQDMPHFPYQLSQCGPKKHHSIFFSYIFSV